ncbi:hypothetical protein HDV05_008199 [Chytridiales sp. JEL 0842]|nr:hypothetical protein HDV05_008199 [Chytridiales sp. JEL 0842]
MNEWWRNFQTTSTELDALAESLRPEYLKRLKSQAEIIERISETVFPDAFAEPDVCWAAIDFEFHPKTMVATQVGICDEDGQQQWYLLPYKSESAIDPYEWAQLMLKRYTKRTNWSTWNSNLCDERLFLQFLKCVPSDWSFFRGLVLAQAVWPASGGRCMQRTLFPTRALGAVARILRLNEGLTFHLAGDDANATYRIFKYFARLYRSAVVLSPAARELAMMDASDDMAVLRRCFPKIVRCIEREQVMTDKRALWEYASRFYVYPLEVVEYQRLALLVAKEEEKKKV